MARFVDVKQTLQSINPATISTFATLISSEYFHVGIRDKAFGWHWLLLMRSPLANVKIAPVRGRFCVGDIRDIALVQFKATEIKAGERHEVDEKDKTPDAHESTPSAFYVNYVVHLILHAVEHLSGCISSQTH